MKILAVTLATTVSVVATGVAAQAADLILDAPAVMAEAAASDWTGPYIGIQAGVVSLTTVEVYAADPDGATYELGAYGGTVGLFAGFDYQLDDMFVLGLSGEVNLDNVAIGYEDDGEYMTLDWDAAIKVRAGMLLNPATLLYATVGYSVGAFAFSEDYWGPDYSSEATTGGWIVGGGIESEVADGLFVRGEATATFYDDIDLEYLDDPYLISTPTVVKATLGLAYKF